MVRFAELRLMATFQAARSELEWCQKCLLLLLPQFDPAIEMMTAFWTANLELTTYPKYLPLLHVDHMKVPHSAEQLYFVSQACQIDQFFLLCAISFMISLLLFCSFFLVLTCEVSELLNKERQTENVLNIHF
jgi:hypothetical protein